VSQDLYQALGHGLSDCDVTRVDVLEETWHEQILDLRYVEQFDLGGELVQETCMLAPQAYLCVQGLIKR